MHSPSTNRISQAGFFFTTSKSKFKKSGLAALTTAILPAAVLLLCIATSYAGSATWNVNPGSADWNNANNWTPMTVPNGPNDTATFQSSNQANIFLSANTEVNAIIFSPSTSNFFFIVNPSFTLTISGTGITNSSGFTEALNTAHGGAHIAFINAATAGDRVIFGNGQNSTITFSNSTSAGTASFINYSGSITSFHGLSTAGSATFTNSTSGNTSFHNSSTAGNATLKGASFHDFSTAGNATLNGSATFNNSSTAGNATLTGGAAFADNSAAMTATLTGSIVFSGNATGDMASVKVFGNSNLDISAHTAPGVTVGSIEGDGSVSLGANRLTVGSNNIDTTFSGQIKSSTGGGSLGKTGTGTLVLANSNTYASGTTIDQGTLRAAHDGALGVGAQNGSFVSIGPNGILTLDSGATNNYISDRASLIIVTGSTVNLNYSGAPDRLRSLIVDGIAQPVGIYGGPASGAPNQLPQFTGTGTIIAPTKAVSRKVHGNAGSFDVDLPLAGPAGIECRSGGPTNDHQIVITFFNNVTFGNAAVIYGTGSVASTSGSGTNTATINLTNVANAQTIKVVLFDVNDGTSTTNLLIPLSVLLGDITGNGSVNASDVSQIRPGRPIDGSNFRQDVTINGVINSSDVSTVKLKSGTALP